MPFLHLHIPRHSSRPCAMGMPLHPVNCVLLGDAPWRAPLLASYKPSLYMDCFLVSETRILRGNFSVNSLQSCSQLLGTWKPQPTMSWRRKGDSLTYRRIVQHLSPFFSVSKSPSLISASLLGARRKLQNLAAGLRSSGERVSP